MPISLRCVPYRNSILIKSGDAEMRSHHGLVFLLLSLTVFAGCGEDAEIPEDPVDQIQNGDVSGIVTNEETSEPVEGASVNMDGIAALTDADGRYVVQGIPFSDRVEIGVTATDYREYNTTISLDQGLVIFNISLVPVDSLTTQILDVLESLSQDIEALDVDKTPSVQSHFSEDYAAADDQATFFGVLAGVVPPDYHGMPDTVKNIVEKYDKIKFRFVDPDVDLSEDTAIVLMRLEIYAETKPKPPDPAKKWEIIANGRLDLRKENSGWKITFWQLIPDFIKFEEEPLE